MSQRELRIKRRTARGPDCPLGDRRDKEHFATGKMKRAGVYATRRRS